ncbi:hypothetical protein E1287_07055 [Actinomadura sp. KC06]|uniref:hypothetical protein n=1 Tax=Actinomadura sp. KC06 TaxID=2530369 RepID=UPI00104FE46E|nr:hypothetical protein [Actinomadura sp. KC06]TDD37811.1 hypothetical protein E1287_07055 [Actinomadura sp. KC06]
MEDTFALWRQIKELKDRVATLTQERDLKEIDRQCAVAGLAHAYQLKRPPGDVPAVLVHALRSISPEPFQRVRLDIDGQQLHALVDGAACCADPGAESKVWDWLADHAEAPPDHPFAREKMPDRLLGAAWPDGQIAVSASLSGREVVDARRALLARRRRRNPVRALSTALLPGAAVGRGILNLLRDAQAATTAVAGVSSALPAVTAAAISCTAVTSCAPAITIDHGPPPAVVREVDYTLPKTEDEPTDPPARKPGRRPTLPAEVEREEVPAPASNPAPAKSAPLTEPGDGSTAPTDEPADEPAAEPPPQPSTDEGPAPTPAPTETATTDPGLAADPPSTGTPVDPADEPVDPADDGSLLEAPDSPGEADVPGAPNTPPATATMPGPGFEQLQPAPLIALFF